MSYRIGEKGSVKILYSESLDGSYLQNYAMQDDSSPEAAAVAAATAAAMAAAAAYHNNSRGSTGGGQNFLPLDNLNLAMGGMTLNSNQSAASPNSTSGVTTNAPVVPSSGQDQRSQAAPGQKVAPGFAPFQPRQHAPITYTAGTFAQTKFGSTKLKSNAKKTNRMSPTEFSNYIKQRAMQKQGSMPVNTTTAVQQGQNSGSQHGFMPISAPSTNTNGFRSQNSNRNGFHSHHNSGGNNLNYGGGSGRIPPHQSQQDPYFYPLFPDRGGQNFYSSGQPTQGQQQPQGQPATAATSSGSSSASSSSSSSSNPWSFGDADAELFLQDILTVGLNSGKSGNLFNNDFNYGNSGSNSSSFGSNSSSSSSLGLSMLGSLQQGFTPPGGGLNNGMNQLGSLDQDYIDKKSPGDSSAENSASQAAGQERKEEKERFGGQQRQCGLVAN